MIEQKYRTNIAISTCRESKLRAKFSFGCSCSTGNRYTPCVHSLILPAFYVRLLSAFK